MASKTPGMKYMIPTSMSGFARILIVPLNSAGFLVFLFNELNENYD